MKRHVAGHENEKSPKRSNAAPHVARVAQACTACATAKLRCGNDKPCRRCQHKGIPCTFSSPGERNRNSSRVREFSPSEFRRPLARLGQGHVEVHRRLLARRGLSGCSLCVQRYSQKCTSAVKSIPGRSHGVRFHTHRNNRSDGRFPEHCCEIHCSNSTGPESKAAMRLA